MAFVTKNTYTTARGTYNRRKRTFSGSGAPPAGYSKAPAPTIATTPVTTISRSPSGARRVTRKVPGSPPRTYTLPSNLTPHQLVSEVHALLTDIPTAKETAEAAHRLGVKAQESPLEKLLSGSEHAISQGVRDATQAVVKLPHEPVSAAWGHKTLGTPSVAQVLHASRAGKVKLNKDGKLTIPATRSAARGLAVARKRFQRTARPDLSGLSPAEREVARDALKAHRKYPDVPASVLMSDVRQESGFNAAAKSPTGAGGLSQFEPATAAEYGVQYGTGKREKQSQVTGQAHYLHDLGFGRNPQAALSAYSGGYAASAYNDPVLQGARDYAALDKRTAVNPKALKVLAKAKARASSLGISTKPRSVAERLGPAPKQVVSRFKAAVTAAHELAAAHVPYVWGGGHGKFTAAGGLDCSGAVSFVLHRMGVLEHPLSSAEMGQVLKPGPGAVTVFYNAAHTFMRIGNRYFGTSVDDSSKGLAFYKSPPRQYLAQFNVGHVAGMGRKQALQLGVQTPTVGSATAMPGMMLSPDGTTATIQPGAGVQQRTPGVSRAPIAPSTGVPVSSLLSTVSLSPSDVMGAATAARAEAEPETTLEKILGRRSL
jgi:soluble lytic murein transglycosylase-like protein